MTQLSLPWLGLGPVAASPWLIGLLVGASWLLARILTRIYAFYENSRRLQCFPQPPKRNWILGHLGMIPPTEQGLKEVAKLVDTYSQGFISWLGPIIPLITLCHPDIIRTVLNASGTCVERVVVDAIVRPRASSPSPHPCVKPLQRLVSSFPLLSASSHLLSYAHQSPFPSSSSPVMPHPHPDVLGPLKLQEASFQGSVLEELSILRR